MATRSRIGIERKDGTVKSVYCHNDGYPSGVGEWVRMNLTEAEEIEEYLDKGDISTVELSYKEWRDEDCPAKISHSVDEFLRINSGAEYMYLLTNGKWKTYRMGY